jgi:hypothetical protein
MASYSGDMSPRSRRVITLLVLVGLVAVVLVAAIGQG